MHISAVEAKNLGGFLRLRSARGESRWSAVQLFPSALRPSVRPLVRGCFKFFRQGGRWIPRSPSTVVSSFVRSPKREGGTEGEEADVRELQQEKMHPPAMASMCTKLSSQYNFKHYICYTLLPLFTTCLPSFPFYLPASSIKTSRTNRLGKSRLPFATVSLIHFELSRPFSCVAIPTM